MLESLLPFVKANALKLFVLVIPAGLFTYTAQDFQAVQLLFIVLGVDILLGIALAIKMRRFSSHRMGACIPRMIGYMVAIILLTVIMRIIPEAAFLFYYTLTLFIFREISSHIENLSLLGIKFPDKVMKLINSEYEDIEKAKKKWIEKNRNSF
ncbi:MAG: phage holin family protein [Candidatus Heimdallarchaeota archaeon]